ncbi:trehalose-phosphatase [Haloarcula salinisoli]|uniref:Trehalose 6-phosphate phosphatase n=1 Tax=Haloarcula salinisoli TaxID=2487746 RepID=A0A8J7YE99_9EURY|nr:trehalose-phosphatase [Halomicroarcula salinisoli]MBX0287181.1 trehalose-phosphatase [Halomicroarcula salinisoli]MBX0304485.1 trehalose-phosphatase [Halomicroarcula salinisoli]
MTAQQQTPVANVYSIDRQLGEAEGLLVALDFDGTLAPIEDDPDAPEITPANRRAVEQLQDHPDTMVAVVSGRQLADLRPRVGIEGIRYVGNHGLEYTVDGEREVHPEAEARMADLQRVREEIETRLADMAGVHVEDKAVTLTVHYRRAKDASAEAVTAIVNEVVDPVEGLKTGSGKMIVEVKPTVDWHKGAIVEWLADEVPDTWRTVYVGDDTTDEDAFKVLGEGDFGVLVGERSTAADYRVPAQCEVSRLLNWLLGVLEGEMPEEDREKQ